MSSWKIYSDTKYYFCTTTITDWYPIFTDLDYFNIITDSLQFCRKNKGLKIHSYVIMLNHIHLIVSCGPSSSLSNIFRDFKRHTSRELSSLLYEKNQIYALQLFKKATKEKNQNYGFRLWVDCLQPFYLVMLSLFFR